MTGNSPKEASIRVPTWPTRPLPRLFRFLLARSLLHFTLHHVRLGKATSVFAVCRVFLGASQAGGGGTDQHCILGTHQGLLGPQKDSKRCRLDGASDGGEAKTSHI